jgi:hypothetical protein
MAHKFPRDRYEEKGKYFLKIRNEDAEQTGKPKQNFFQHGE